MDQASFDVYRDIPFHESGDWPPSPQELLHRFLPREVLEECGYDHMDNCGVDVLVRTWEDNRAKVLERLTELGHTMLEDPRPVSLTEPLLVAMTAGIQGAVTAQFSGPKRQLL